MQQRNIQYEFEILSLVKPILNIENLNLSSKLRELALDSLSLLRITVAIEQKFSVELSLSSLMEMENFQTLADYVQEKLQKMQATKPFHFFMVLPLSDAKMFYTEVSQSLIGVVNVHYVNPLNFLGQREELPKNLEKVIDSMSAFILNKNQGEPIYLGGFSAGGAMAYELGKKIESLITERVTLFLFDAHPDLAYLANHMPEDEIFFASVQNTLKNQGIFCQILKAHYDSLVGIESKKKYLMDAIEQGAGSDSQTLFQQAMEVNAKSIFLLELAKKYERKNQFNQTSYIYIAENHSEKISVPSWDRYFSFPPQFNHYHETHWSLMFSHRLHREIIGIFLGARSI